MDTDVLVVLTDAAIDTIPSPGVGSALEVLAYQIKEHEDSTANITAAGYLKFVTSGRDVWRGTTIAPGADREVQHNLSGLRVRGNEDEALTLKNANVTAGTANHIVAIVFYRVVMI